MKTSSVSSKLGSNHLTWICLLLVGFCKPITHKLLPLGTCLLQILYYFLIQFFRIIYFVFIYFFQILFFYFQIFHFIYFCFYKYLNIRINSCPAYWMLLPEKNQGSGHYRNIFQNLEKIFLRNITGIYFRIRRKYILVTLQGYTSEPGENIS